MYPIHYIVNSDRFPANRGFLTLEINHIHVILVPPSS